MTSSRTAVGFRPCRQNHVPQEVNASQVAIAGRLQVGDGPDTKHDVRFIDRVAVDRLEVKPLLWFVREHQTVYALFQAS